MDQHILLIYKTSDQWYLKITIEIKTLIERANSKLLDNKVAEYKTLSADLSIPLSKMTSKRLSFLPTLISVAEAKEQ